MLLAKGFEPARVHLASVLPLVDYVASVEYPFPAVAFRPCPFLHSGLRSSTESYRNLPDFVGILVVTR